MAHYYSVEKNVQIIVALLKAHGIHKVIASPGATNVSLVESMQNDSWFEMYSEVDERNAAYMACGMASESGEPVVITCTGATSSRDYMPGLTEAFYRHIPVLAITCCRDNNLIGHNVDQVTDRTQLPNDIANVSVQVQIVRCPEDEWDVMIKVNKAILGLFRNGGGPCHINMATGRETDFSIKKLPPVRVINRYFHGDILPEIPNGRIGIFVGAHERWSSELEEEVTKFCSIYDACVFCDHTSNYKGKYRVLFPLINDQCGNDQGARSINLLIHIGNISNCVFKGKTIWRVNPDGEIRDTFKKMKNIFQMQEIDFFKYYTKGKEKGSKESLLNEYKKQYNYLYSLIPELPFSNIWIAQQLSKLIPTNSVIHLGIRNSIRSWNYFEVPNTVLGYCNTGGFGIDGGVSSLVGASFVNRKKLHFGIFGDLLFFYNLNAIGNREISSNIRIIVINNGLGQEFKNYCCGASKLGEDTNKFIAAEGHFGNKSNTLIKMYAENLGFEYLTASSKEEFMNISDRFVTTQITDKPMLLEVFTNTEDESKAFEKITLLTPESKLAKKITEIKDSNKLKGIKETVKKIIQ